MKKPIIFQQNMIQNKYVVKNINERKEEQGQQLDDPDLFRGAKLILSHVYEIVFSFLSHFVRFLI
jgi:hypothetical protein